MSFRAKTILLMIGISLAPYLVTMWILGSAYRADVEARVIDDMGFQLQMTVDRLDQSLRVLRTDMNFMASLDIMNDVLTGDLDRRIVNLLLSKKGDLALLGDFEVADMQGRVVASTDAARIGNSQALQPFASVPIHSTVVDSQIGTLSVFYDTANLTRLFPQQSYAFYQLLNADEVPVESTSDGNYAVETDLPGDQHFRVRLEQQREFAFEALDRFNRSFLLALAIGIVLIASVAYGLANHLLKPVLALSSTVRTVTQTQDYSQRARVTRSDEIGQLATAFNSMIQGMQEMIARLQVESENRIKLAQEQHRSEMLQSLSSKLSKYLSPQIYESIFSGEKEVALGSSRKKLTVFFSDIVNFTGTTDQMESEDLTQLLNHYLREMTDIALQYGATIDKYIGDAVMIFFGDPHSAGVAEDAQRCVAMAVAMQHRVRELQGEWRRSGFTRPFSIRAGIHTGYCTVGNFGTENRMDYTIVGSAVNLASRIESRAEPDSIFISEDTYLLVKDKFPCVPVSAFTPKGFNHPLQLYQVLYEQTASALTIQEEGIQLVCEPDRLSAEGRRKLAEVMARILGS